MLGRIVSHSVFTVMVFGLVACNQAQFAGSGKTRGAKATDNPSGPTSNPLTPSGPGANTPSGKTNTPIDVSTFPPGGSNNPNPNSNPPGVGTPTAPRPGVGGGTAQRQFKVQCSQGADSSIATVEVNVPRDQRVEAQIQGEFCPNSTNKLSVLFVVDFSASMGKHKFSGDGQVYDGNDPEANGSCGRLEAAKAVLTKIESMAKAGDAVQIGMIPFASAVVKEHVIKFRDLASFKASLNKDAFCRYVAQGSQYFGPGSLDAATVSAGSSTNYGAAFLAAEDMLAGRSGQKLVYFVSDGEPTSPSSDPVGSGVRAGKNLRDRINNLTVNGLLLKTRNSSAIDILNRVTGSPDRVKLVDQASQLADKILEFKNAAIDERFGSAKIYASPYPEQDLGLVSMTKTSDQVWTYLTQPFVLVGAPGAMIENRVTVLAKGVDGSVHSSVITIRYLQQ